MIFLTGGSGFLGRAILAGLAERNINVRCIYRKNKPTDFRNVTWIKGDLLDHNLDESLLSGCDSIIHCAGEIKGPEALLEKINYQATQRLLELACKAKVQKFIFLSSIDVFLFDSAYTRSKKLAEEYIKSSNIKWFIVRPSVIFGLNDDKNFYLLNNLIRKLPVILLPFAGKFRWEPVFVDDLAEYIIGLALQEDGWGRISNVVGPEQLTFEEITKILQKYNGINKLTIPVPSFVMNALRIFLALVIGRHKTEQVFSTFMDKIILPQQEGDKVLLPTKFSWIFKR